MRRMILLIALLLGCDRYKANDGELVTAYTAKMTCSCIFEMKRSEDFCRGFAREEPDVTTVSIDRDARIVEAQALGIYGARARFLDERRGCVSERD